MRLVGATPRQISVISTVESLGRGRRRGAGFGLFFAAAAPLRPIPFTGEPFFPGDLSLSLPTPVVAIGVPVAAAVVARLALRRVQHLPARGHPAGDPARRGPGGCSRCWPAWPNSATSWCAAADDHRRQVQALLAGFALVMIGLVLAGPWLTMAGRADDGPADQPPGDPDRRAAAGRQPAGRLPRGQRPGPRPVHHHRGRATSAPMTPRRDHAGRRRHDQQHPGRPPARQAFSPPRAGGSQLNPPALAPIPPRRHAADPPEGD